MLAIWMDYIEAEFMIESFDGLIYGDCITMPKVSVGSVEINS